MLSSLGGSSPPPVAPGAWPRLACSWPGSLGFHVTRSTTTRSRSSTGTRIATAHPSTGILYPPVSVCDCPPFFQLDRMLSHEYPALASREFAPPEFLSQSCSSLSK